MKNWKSYSYILILIAVIAFSMIIIYHKKEFVKTNYNMIDNIDITYKYLTSNGCTSDMSNNAYTACASSILEKIKREKQTHFDKLQKLINSRPDNALLSDKEVNKQFLDWYKNSEQNNHLRCVANVYWTIAGSAYEQNMYICEIFETQRDIQLLDDNYKGFEDSISTMDIK